MTTLITKGTLTMKRMQNASLVAIVMMALFTTAVVTPVHAGGDRVSPRLVGMGRTFTAFSRGLDAVGTNPANVALNDRDATVTINLVPLGFSLGSDFFNLKIYNKFTEGVADPLPGKPDHKTGMELSDADKEEILGLFPGGVSHTQIRNEVAPIGISLQIGNFGLAIVPALISTSASIDLDKAYLEFPLYMYPEGKSYSFSGTAVNAQSVAESNVSLAYMLPFELPFVSEISLGVGVKYLQGLGFVATDHYTGSIEALSSEVSPGVRVNTGTKVDFDFLQWVSRIDPNDPTKPAGTGIGYDVGVNFRLLENIQVGASVTDIGKIKWTGNTKAIIGNAHFQLAAAGDKENQDKLKNAFKGRTVDTTGFEFDLPTAAHVGIAVQMDDVLEFLPFRWVVAADGHFGMNNIGGNTKTPQFSLGTELDPLAGWLPLRAGIMTGGGDLFSLSAGFGLHLANTLDLDFATQSLAIVTNPETFRTGSFTMGMRLRF